MNTLLSFDIQEQNMQHVRIRVFNRGGLAGVLTVLTKDIEAIMRRLSGEEIRALEVKIKDLEDELYLMTFSSPST